MKAELDVSTNPELHIGLASLRHPVMTFHPLLTSLLCRPDDDPIVVLHKVAEMIFRVGLAVLFACPMHSMGCRRQTEDCIATQP